MALVPALRLALWVITLFRIEFFATTLSELAAFSRSVEGQKLPIQNNPQHIHTTTNVLCAKQCSVPNVLNMIAEFIPLLLGCVRNDCLKADLE